MLKYNISDELEVTVRIHNNPYDIPPEKLFTMAARKNKKRSFLFVSKVLGKHIPANPDLAILNGMALAARYYEETCKTRLPQTGDILSVLKTGKGSEETYRKIKENLFPLERPTLFIGFAETATALGHAVFESFSDNAFYIHTTRENIAEAKNKIAFEEEHSHATSHRVYPLGSDMPGSDCPVVIVDDEMTTGKTALNIIEAIHRIHPRRAYSVLSILDWRTTEHRALFNEKEKSLNAEIQTISLLAGTIEVNEKSDNKLSGYASDVLEINAMNSPAINNAGAFPAEVEHLSLDSFFSEFVLCSSADSNGDKNTTPYLKGTGRFGIHSEGNAAMREQLRQAGLYLKGFRNSKKTLCMGTGEFMHIPMKIASHMGEEVSYQSTTRSPICPNDKHGYGAKSAYVFESPEDANVMNYFYNIPHGHYGDIYIFFEREIKKKRLEPLVEQLKKTGAEKIFIVTCSGNKDSLPEPGHIGSYPQEDVVFLLKDVGNLMKEQGNEDREKAIQAGVHYSEMLPMEYRPSEEYMKIFHSSLKKYDEKIAIASGLVAEKIIKKRGRNIVLVSLARAGTPAGILIRRYLKYRYNLDLPHYSISIIRGKGTDENAIRYILKNHPGLEIQFVDGWTGKGSITKELLLSCAAFEKKWGIPLSSDMAVIADPGYCAGLFGTRDDFMIPSACLNSTVSGLVSRTIHRDDLIGENDFHGVRFYKELIKEDVSNLFTDSITEKYPSVTEKVLDLLPGP